MIGFGELRRLSVAWQVDVTAVERVYAIGWLLKGIANNAGLSDVLVLRGGAALRFAHCSEFPLADDPEYSAAGEIENALIQEMLAAAAGSSGLKFSLASFVHGSAKVEYTGPLGRRSAAQPRISLSITRGKFRLEPERVPFLDAFGDGGSVTLSVLALDEWLGDHIVGFARTPRARDVYDLWFGLSHLSHRASLARVRQIAEDSAREKNLPLPDRQALFAPSHRAILERAWDNALREARGHPTLAQVERDLSDLLGFLQ